MVFSVSESRQKRFWSKRNGRRSPGHPVVVAFAEPKVDFIRECIGKEKFGVEIKQILDVGCGNGFFTCTLAACANCTALDLSQGMLDMNPAGAAKVCGDAKSMPFPDNTFDLVFCSNLLHHVSDQFAVVMEMKRVSKQYVAISEPNRNNPLMFAFGLLKPVERGTLKFSSGYLAKLVIKAGLRPLCVQTMGAILPNKTPLSLLWLFKLFDGTYPMAFYNVIVCRKQR